MFGTAAASVTPVAVHTYRGRLTVPMASDVVERVVRVVSELSGGVGVLNRPPTASSTSRWRLRIPISTLRRLSTPLTSERNVFTSPAEVGNLSFDFCDISFDSCNIGLETGFDSCDIGFEVVEAVLHEYQYDYRPGPDESRDTPNPPPPQRKPPV